MPMPYHWFKNEWKILQNFWSGKPYKIIEWKNWDGACDFSKEFILTESTRSIVLLGLKGNFSKEFILTETTRSIVLLDLKDSIN